MYQINIYVVNLIYLLIMILKFNLFFEKLVKILKNSKVYDLLLLMGLVLLLMVLYVIYLSIKYSSVNFLIFIKFSWIAIVMCCLIVYIFNFLFICALLIVLILFRINMDSGYNFNVKKYFRTYYNLLFHDFCNFSVKYYSIIVFISSNCVNWLI